MNFSTDEKWNYFARAVYREVLIQELENSELIKAYSRLAFNGGFLLKKVTTTHPVKFRDYLHALDKTIINENYDGNIWPRANPDINDFIFHFLKNDSIKQKKWGWNEEEDNDFVVIREEYDGLQKFRNLPCWEISTSEFEDRLVQMVLGGTCYSDWKYPLAKTTKMVAHFAKLIFQSTPSYRVFDIQEWGYPAIGAFRCFLIIDLNAPALIYCCKDDYD